MSEPAFPLPARPETFRITGLRTVVINADLRNWVFVRVETDQPGLYGWGEATLEWKTRGVVGTIEDLEPILIGRDPRDIEGTLRALRKHGFWRLGAIGESAISGIELALWDIFGKSVGLPVWRLLGGRVRDRVGIYTHLGLGHSDSVYGSMDPESVADMASEIVEKGYKALKVLAVPYTHMSVTGRGLDQAEQAMGAIRERVGNDVEIMVDFHGRCGSIAAALAYIDVLRPFRPLFIEEPLQPDDEEGLIALSRQSSVPLATGERLIGKSQFDRIFASRAIAVAQPDICHTGGLLETKAIAAMAANAGIAMAPHNPLGPIAGAAALHFAVSTPNFLTQEEMVGAVAWFGEVVDGPVCFDAGFWQVPDAPGLGVEVDETVAARHPYKPEPFITTEAAMEDGTIVDW
ncbi:galactonate dehydratase [Pararhizobium mangrovi]|uniref:Galactonate dehydratase n=1 Tax=Pararhizobium mangrovi TaxID=2590452 RepID=A0A506UBF2_9HYPH|nr:galactonate dehydratase [Pararhizobium mangrovi]TPW30344.1 galactonate dehydratase [Pararhizobium mangrovi]